MWAMLLCIMTFHGMACHLVTTAFHSLGVILQILVRVERLSILSADGLGHILRLGQLIVQPLGYASEKFLFQEIRRTIVCLMVEGVAGSCSHRRG